MKEDKKIKLQEKFSSIYKKSKRINLKKIDLIYDYISQNTNRLKKYSTITEIAEKLNLTRNSVRNYAKILEKERYIKKNRQYTPPFLKCTDRKADSTFIYGKEKKENKINEETKKVLGFIKSAKIQLPTDLAIAGELLKTNRLYDSKFL